MMILFVDDNEGMRNVYGEMMSLFFPNVEAEFGCSALEGWKLYERFHPDLVVTDMEMEVWTSGLWLANKVNGAVPVILVSGMSPEDRVWGEEAEVFFKEMIDGGKVSHFLKKPIDLEEFVEVIKLYIGG